MRGAARFSQGWAAPATSVNHHLCWDRTRWGSRRRRSTTRSSAGSRGQHADRIQKRPVRASGERASMPPVFLPPRTARPDGRRRALATTEAGAGRIGECSPQRRTASRATWPTRAVARSYSDQSSLSVTAAGPASISLLCVIRSSRRRVGGPATPPVGHLAQRGRHAQAVCAYHPRVRWHWVRRRP